MASSVPVKHDLNTNAEQQERGHARYGICALSSEQARHAVGVAVCVQDCSGDGDRADERHQRGLKRTLYDSRPIGGQRHRCCNAARTGRQRNSEWENDHPLQGLG